MTSDSIEAYCVAALTNVGCGEKLKLYCYTDMLLQYKIMEVLYHYVIIIIIAFCLCHQVYTSQWLKAKYR